MVCSLIVCLYIMCFSMGFVTQLFFIRISFRKWKCTHSSMFKSNRTIHTIIQLKTTEEKEYQLQRKRTLVSFGYFLQCYIMMIRYSAIKHHPQQFFDCNTSWRIARTHDRRSGRPFTDRTFLILPLHEYPHDPFQWSNTDIVDQ